MAESKKADWRDLYPTTAAQENFFLIKFPDMTDAIHRKALAILRQQFDLFDHALCGELQEDEALQLMEHRGETKTVKELRKMVSGLDLDKNHKLGFLELACSIFHKSWEDLHSQSGDASQVEALTKLSAQAGEFLAHAQAELAKQSEMTHEQQAAAQKAKEEAFAAAQAQAQLEAELEHKRHEEEEKKKSAEDQKAAALGQKGVKGAGAKFLYAALNTHDTTADNATRIKKEAAEKKAQKEAAAKAASAKAEAEKKEREAQAAAEQLAKQMEEKARAENDLKESEKQKALAEKARIEKEAFDAAQKAKAEEEAKAKAEKEQKQAEARARLAAKAAAFAKK
jgi:hypothetical protein